MLFYSSRYDFRFPRYRRVKKRVIFNNLLSPSLLFIRIFRSHLGALTYPKLQTSGRRNSWKNVVRDSWKNVVRISRKKCRSRRRGPIHNLRAVLSITKTLSPYISATDWDIGINQKGISMVYYSLFPEWILMIKFLILLAFFIQKIKVLFVILRKCNDLSWLIQSTYILIEFSICFMNIWTF